MQIKNSRLFLLIGCLCLTGAVIYFSPSRQACHIDRTITLKQALSVIPAWTLVAFHPLDKKIIESLKLDDYLNADYSSSAGNVSLYIGYYFTGNKVGAAHDPMVCFPGQGWNLSGIQKASVHVPSTDKEIVYSSMVAARRDSRQLVVYWFQAGEKTSPDTFGQKVNTLINKISNKPGENAFVRVTMKLDGMSQQQGEAVINKFINAFYPVFLQYVQGSKSR